MKTITAIATPLMKCAIHIIRISGDDAYEIVNSIIDKPITKEPYKISRSNIYDNSELVDDVLLLKYVAPKSYTGEDMVEITCHGSVYVAKKILSLLIEHGASMADHGEFTKRAFLNNKITLLQAEGINNVINSNSEKSLKIANKCTNKKMSDWIQKMADDLFKITGQIEVNIDYPEYDDVPQITVSDMKSKINQIINNLKKIINDSKEVIPLLNGIDVAIVGSPNAGKSSLLNAFLKQNVAIVSNVPGTTRDIIQYSVVIDGITYNFIDTAGIHKPTDKIEKVGINKSKEAIKKAKLILFVIDGSKKENEDTKKIYQLIKRKPHIIVLNKSDLTKKAEINGISVCAKKQEIKNLIEAIIEKSQSINSNIETLLPSEKDISLAKNVIKILKDCMNEINNNQPIDLLNEYFHKAHQQLLTIIGKTENFNFIDQLFKSFCVGK